MRRINLDISKTSFSMDYDRFDLKLYKSNHYLEQYLLFLDNALVRNCAYFAIVIYAGIPIHFF